MLYYSYNNYVDCIYHIIANITTWTYKANYTMLKNNNNH